jgi:5'-3' exonuclease
MARPDLIEEDVSQNIVVLDGHNVIFRTIFIAHEEVKKSGYDDPKYTYWKTMFMYNIKGVVEKFNPTRLIIVFDSKGSWRKGFYSEYKANRKDAREESDIDFKEFFKVLEPFLDDLIEVFPNLEILKIDGVEGDDVIAVLCKNFNDKITIISTDKDFYQLQTFKNVKQYNPVEREFAKCLNPKVALEMKIIGGDVSDNIPAIYPRCGKKSVEFVISTNFLSKIYDDDYLKEEKNVNELMKKCKIHPLEVRKNVERNTQLIDFKHIPLEIQDMILERLKNPNTKQFSGRKFMSFLVTHGLGKLIQKASEYTETLGKIHYKGSL